MRGAGVRLVTLLVAVLALGATAWIAPSAAADRKAPLADAPIGTGLDDSSAPKIAWPEPTPETAGLDHVAEIRLLRRPDGSVVLSGMRWGKVDGEHRRGYWLAYLNADGRAERQVLVPISENEIPTDAIATSDGGFLLFSWIRELWLIRLDPEGRRSWNVRLDDHEISEAFPPKVAQLPDGGFLVGGSAAGPSRDEVRYRLTHVAADGHIVWQRNYGRRGNRSIVSLAPLSDGTTLVLGSDDLFAVDRQGRTRWSRPSNAILDMSASDGQSVVVIEYGRKHQEWVWGPRFHLARLDRNGRTMWRRDQDIGSPGLADSRADRLVPAPGGEFLLFLARELTSEATPGIDRSYWRNPHAIVLSIARYDTTGRRLWLRTIEGPDDTGSSVYSNGIENAIVLPNGNLFVLGTAWSRTESHFDEWWLRTAPFD